MAERPVSRWVERVVAASAFLISVLSLYAALQGERTQERMLSAASWPILEYTTGNMSNEKLLINLSVKNSGAGPARIKWAVVRYQGKAVRGWGELLSACCGWTHDDAVRLERLFAAPRPAVELGRLPTSSFLAPAVIPAGGSVDFLLVPRDPAEPAVWDLLNRARFQVAFDVCYCSVLDECWRGDLKGGDPVQVKGCGKPPSDAFH